MPAGGRPPAEDAVVYLNLLWNLPMDKPSSLCLRVLSFPPLQFKPPSVPSSVEAYLAVSPGPLGYSAHFATWQSAVLGFASIPALRALRKANAAKVAPSAEAKGPVGPRPCPPTGIEFILHPEVKSFSVPFPGVIVQV